MKSCPSLASAAAGGSERIFTGEETFSLPFDQSRAGSVLYATGKGGPDLWVFPGSGDRTPFCLTPGLGK